MALDRTTDPFGQPDRASATFDETKRPGCPAWCRGHHPDESDRWLTHHSRNERVGYTSADEYTVTVSLMFAETYSREPVVMVMEHVKNEATYVTQDDAARWATILDGAGAAELAAAIRQTLARVES